MPTIITKNSSTASSVPTAAQLLQGELAVNVTDRRLFTENASGTVVELGTNPSSLTLPNGTANGVAYLNGSKVLTTGSALTFDGTGFGVVTSAPTVTIFETASGNNNRLVISQPGAVTTYNSTFSSGSAAHAWQTGNTEQMRLTSTGLGIGTSSPAHKLDVNGAIGIGGTKFFSKITGDSYIWNNTSALNFVTSDGNTVQMKLDSSGNLGLGVTPSAWNTVKVFQFGNASVYGNGVADASFTQNAFFQSGWKYIGSAAASQYMQNGGQHQWYTAPSGTAGNAISFTQAMTLDASGNLVVGSTSAVGRFTLENSATTTEITLRSTGGVGTNNRARIIAGYEAGGSDYGGYLAFNTTSSSNVNTERARIDSSGNLLVGTTSIIARVSGVANSGVIAYFTNSSGTGVAMYPGNNAWSSVSDERAKIINNPISDAVSKVSSLRAVLGRYKTDDEEKSRAFLIAQDVQAVLPEAVTEQPDGMLALQMTDTIPLLVAAIQELKAEFDAYKATHP